MICEEEACLFTSDDGSKPSSASLGVLRSTQEETALGFFSTVYMQKSSATRLFK